MKKNINFKKVLIAGILSISGVLGISTGQETYARCVPDSYDSSTGRPSSYRGTESGEDCSNYTGDGAFQEGIDETSNHFGNTTIESAIGNVINTILWVVGILAVVMIVIGGIQYTTSSGDQAKVTKAKNTILYGVVGLIIAVLAYAIVNFVVGRLL